MVALIMRLSNLVYVDVTSYHQTSHPGGLAAPRELSPFGLDHPSDTLVCGLAAHGEFSSYDQRQTSNFQLCNEILRLPPYS
jgi:hypothetical protein